MVVWVSGWPENKQEAFALHCYSENPKWCALTFAEIYNVLILIFKEKIISCEISSP